MLYYNHQKKGDTKMKIYLCGSCGSTERTRMVKVAELLRSLGYEVYCPFELQIPNAWDMSQEDWAEKVFKADVQAILHSDIFLFISVGMTVRCYFALIVFIDLISFVCSLLYFLFCFSSSLTNLIIYSLLS